MKIKQNLKELSGTACGAALVVFIVSLTLFSIGIGRSTIYILDESKNAACAWEMMNSGDLITPVFNGTLRTDKPPLHYYFMMAGYNIFGKTAAGARFFSPLSGAVLLTFLFLFVMKYADRDSAFWTIVTLLSSILFVAEFHLAVPDPYLITFLGLGLMAFYHFSQTRNITALLLMYLFLSLGFLTKGPVAVILPGIIIFLFLILSKKFTVKYLLSMKPLAGIIIFAITVLPWYILVHIKTGGEWTRGFFLHHNLNRFTSTMEGHGGSFLVTAGYFVTGLLPFIVFLPGIIRRAWSERESGLVLYSAVIVLVFLLFFSVSRTKLPNYAMPSFPFAAILIASFLSKAARSGAKEHVNIRTGLWILMVLSVLIPVALTFGSSLEPLIANKKGLGLFFIFMPPGIILALIFDLLSHFRKALLTVSATFITAGIVFNLFLVPAVDKHNPVATNIELLKKSENVKYYRTINPSFIFNYGKIESISDTASVRLFLQKRSNILITSLKAVKENPEFWDNYQILYSGKDLYDVNNTLIFCGKDD